MKKNNYYCKKLFYRLYEEILPLSIEFQNHIVNILIVYLTATIHVVVLVPIKVYSFHILVSLLNILL